LLRLLLEAKANPDTPDVVFTARFGHTQMLELLLANKADVHAADQVTIII
jgi:hypothetical protein